MQTPYEDAVSKFRDAKEKHGEVLALLEEIKQACLFPEDGNQIGVTNEPYISPNLFNRICKVLNT